MGESTVDVIVSEVGPRDGLQSIRPVMPTDAKHRWIRALADSGLREIEVGSFVHPGLLPQMADADAVVREALRLPGLTVLALVPNLKGAERAMAAGAHKITVPVSASQAHNRANVRMSCEESIDAVAAICRLRDERRSPMAVEVGIASAFGCSREGPVDEDWVIEMAVRLARAGVDSVGLSDSVGHGNPAQVRRMFRRLIAELGSKAGGAHLHNTRGQGLANVVAALDAGVTTFDASQGGLGGCPYAPGATGNIVTEDLVYLLESMGLDTGIDIGRLLAARAILAGALPGETLYGHVPDAGVHKGFVPARAARPSPQAPASSSASSSASESPSAASAEPPPAVSVSGSDASLPLAGVRVMELTHMVMGPSCGLILADLGAEVIKVEPPGRSPEQPGDHTRYLVNSGAGFFAACNRNKKSVILDLDSDEGRSAARRLAASVDVLIENFRPGALDAKGLGYDALRAASPGLVYCSLKGFLNGPYEHRTALDEVVQMMSGLAVMTGPEGRPLRAGAPVNDMMGGLFGAIAILAALRRRERGGHGEHVQAGLFENAAWLVSTHMLQHAVSGIAPVPMPAGRRAWGVYDVFRSADGVDLFVGVVTERQWQIFTEALGEPELLDARYRTNNQRAQARETLIPLVARLLARRSFAALEALCERAGLPFARIAHPSDLFDDPHLASHGGMMDITLADGRRTRVPALPVQFGAERLPIRLDIPKPGEHTAEVLDRLAARP